MRVKLTAKHPRPAAPERAPVRTGSPSARKPVRTERPADTPRPAGASGAAPKAKGAHSAASAPRAQGDKFKRDTAGKRQAPANRGAGTRTRDDERAPRAAGGRFSERTATSAGKPRGEYESRGERKPRGEYESRGERKPRGEYESRGERKPRTEYESRGERKPRAEYESRGDRKPRAEYESRGDRKPRGEYESRGERKPRAEYESRGDRKPRGEYESRGERKPRAEYEPRGDRKPRAEYESRGDRKPRGEYESRGERKPRAEYEPRGDRKPRAEYESRGDRKPRAEYEARAARGPVKRAAAAPNGRPSRPARPAASASSSVSAVNADGTMRLSKRMSELSLCSRREADEWIENGWVRVDGVVVDTLGARVRPEQRIEVSSEAHASQARQVTILLHKPVGYVSGQAEDGYEPAVTLITPANHWEGDRSDTRFSPSHLRTLAPAGRLDIDSTGLLVLTQDGRIAKQLIGEHSGVEKEYLVRVTYGELTTDIDQHFPPEKLALLRFGLSLDDVPLKAAKVSWQNGEQLRFVLREGKKRQIRRMCELVGLHVVGLKRVRMGSVVLGALPQGQWRYLLPNESF
ncbi:pseudouridine synthase [Trinickia fusca]|uniref:Dual-specificity RNA pseudouridine synthase RluF n=1 Tax=Trinickia fusca TaxID=2419777 RepID=A0A494XUT4_9BURK|nr:pseudouridine synthase [Trinickia fusca]RKP52716.1 pseudouridine synthase [Trinickia fusca]